MIQTPTPNTLHPYIAALTNCQRFALISVKGWSVIISDPRKLLCESLLYTASINSRGSDVGGRALGWGGSGVSIVPVCALKCYSIAKLHPQLRRLNENNCSTI